MHTRMSFFGRLAGSHPSRVTNSPKWRWWSRSVCGLAFGIAVLIISGTARAQLLYVSDSTSNSVGVYDATTGVVISKSLIAGPNVPLGLAINWPAILVADSADNVIAEFDARNGSPINAAFILYADPGFVLLSGSTLYVA